MLQIPRSLFAALAVACTLNACGSKANPTEQNAQAAAPTETTPIAATAPAIVEPTASTQPAGTFDLSTVPVSDANLGQFPYLTVLKGLGAVLVSAGKTPQAAIDKIGADEFRKHMKWAADPDHETDTYVIRQKDKEVWVQVAPLGGDGDYALNVTERAAMPQQATLLKADELKKN